VTDGRADTFADLLSLIDDYPALDDPELEQELASALIESETPIDEVSWRYFLSLCRPEQRQRLQVMRDNKVGLRLVQMRDLTVMFDVDPSQAQSVAALFSRRHSARFAVLRNINFELAAGDVLGVIGRNGSGKSTLLRTIMGMFPISTGAVMIHGKPLLLRPGVGMREDLSGRENIITSSLFLGLSLKQARSIVDEVIDFSELEHAIDRPYRYYSDGMRARLVFSVATSLTAEVLMLDELLSAGDISFQEKARRRLHEFIQRARAVIVIEHGMAFVEASATKVLLLHEGEPIYFGKRERAVDRYILDVMSEKTNARALHAGRP
jgi:ABC-type polysaccharide/polyol phosphate transport system ATPase subunit